MNNHQSKLLVAVMALGLFTSGVAEASFYRHRNNGTTHAWYSWSRIKNGVKASLVVAAALIPAVLAFRYLNNPTNRPNPIIKAEMEARAQAIVDDYDNNHIARTTLAGIGAATQAQNNRTRSSSSAMTSEAVFTGATAAANYHLDQSARVQNARALLAHPITPAQIQAQRTTDALIASLGTAIATGTLATLAVVNASH